MIYCPQLFDVINYVTFGWMTCGFMQLGMLQFERKLQKCIRMGIALFKIYVGEVYHWIYVRKSRFEYSYPLILLSPIRFDYMFWVLKMVSSVMVGKKGYSRCSKISNTFLFLFLNKTFVFRAGIKKMLVRMETEETLIRLLLQQSDQGLLCLSRLLWQATSVPNFTVL